MSVCLTESLASLLYHCRDMKAIVHSMASIVMTTISSTRVKAFFELKYISIINEKIITKIY